MSFVRDIIQWNYRRGTWQYDAFCLLIIAFIFLTPKSWFDGGDGERLATQTARLVVKKADVSSGQDGLEKKIKELSGNENARILALRERRSEDGEILYEIDIR
jgi:hypothetical protein